MSEITGKLSTALADRYRIERHLGEGGMATVYLAEDLKHERKVAVKVLRPELAAVLGAERFVQEIKTTANLQHPHILPLHDSGDADGFLYYVMPFIDGETLRDKLNRETQLGIEEAVNITTAIADALDYAHRQSVIHRDIKPENILLHDGRPMVVDFGIALAVSAAAGGRMTETGLSLGTPHYMSPEQATAEKDITPRSDIYSVGCVLYEMLCGDPPHVGPNAQAIVMRILTEEPRPVTDVRKSVPPHVAAAINKVLEKLPADRFETARAFADALRDESFAHSSAGIQPPTVSAGGAMVEASKLRTALMGSTVVAVLAIIAAAWGWLRAPAEPSSPPPVRLTLEAPGITGFGMLLNVAISPDGSAFAVRGPDGIYVRSADQTTFRLLLDTEGGSNPVFSPDGQWVAYRGQDGALLKMGVEGSAPLTLVSGIPVAQPHWGEDGTIVFFSVGPPGVLYRVPETGGEPTRLVDSVAVRHPRLLPDGSGVIFSTRAGLMLLDLETGELQTVVNEGLDGTYVETGHIIYGHPEGGLFAVAFDLDAHEVTGSPIPVMSEVVVVSFNQGAGYSVSRNGTLVYATGIFGGGQGNHQLLLLGIDGTLDTIRLAPRNFPSVSFSPDGRKLAYQEGGGRTQGRTVHTYDIVLGTPTQLTFEGGAHRPHWSPDGTHIVFSSERDGTDAEDLFIKAVDGTASATHVLSMPGDQHATGWPADDIITFSHRGNLWTVDPSSNAPQANPYLQGEYGEGDLRVSPDGRLAAYRSTETGTNEIFVRRFPDPEGQWRITEGGGQAPRWAPDGRTLYYLNGDAIVAARIPPEPPVTVLSRDTVAIIPAIATSWDVDPSSGRMVLIQDVGVSETSGPAPGLLVVVNWFEELKTRVGND